MNSSQELKIPEYKKLDYFISNQTASNNANIKLANSKWEMLSDDAKHFVSHLRGRAKRALKVRKAQEKVMIEMLYLFQEFPELDNPSHWNTVFNRARYAFFVRSKEDLEEWGMKCEKEIKEYLEAKFAEEEEI